MIAHQYTNDLVHETSPYLLQHAHNPVAWHAWNQTTVDLARRLDKPILLSIGYSACHWCHVMEHESFEDEATAEYMNEHFVCIKVDREERPDLDKIYQLAHQLLTQRPGGWPLNVVIAPDTHAPFFAGTYFPRTPRHGMASFVHVLQRITEYYGAHREELAAHTDAIKAAFRQAEPREHADIRAGLLNEAVQALGKIYDRVNGGFGNAPKFPHPTNIGLCLLNQTRTLDAAESRPSSQHIACHTLKAMAEGGLYDQLGGGFYRYSVDREWSVPHFEKMLYDNAQLLPLLVDAWRVSGDDFFAETARSTAEWTTREMQSESGGYYSTLDADSEGEEGKFYVWSLDEIKATLTEAEFAVINTRFGLTKAANFEGKWHLNIEASLATAAARSAVNIERAAILLDSAKQKLLDARNNRVRPNLDNKILTSWNALMIKGMAHAGRILQKQEFVSSAARALGFVRQILWRDSQLLATARGDKAHLNAYLDDYVYLIDAIIELNQSRWCSDEVNFAVSLADALLERFEDVESGGFYFTSNDHEQLLHRSKPADDDATPSGNGIAARVLLRLGHLLGENRYLEAAERTMRAFAAAVNRHPVAHGSLIMAMEEFHHPPEIVTIRGAPESTGEWTRPLLTEHRPHMMVFVIPTNARDLPGILPELRHRSAITAYICRGTTCSAPINTIAEFANSFNEGKHHA